MPFTATRLDVLPEIVLIEPKTFHDERGWFLESYKKSDFARLGIPVNFPHRVVITGDAGYIGSVLTEMLASRGWIR